MTFILLRHVWIRWKTFLTLCLCVPLLSGCWDSHELEHMFYIHAIGVDYQGGKYVIYAQVLNPMALAKESSKSPEQIGAWIGKGVGPSLEDAVHSLYATTQRMVYWGHLDAIVFSETLLAQKGVQEALDILTRFREVRYTSWVFCTNSAVAKVLSAEPILESSPVYSVLADPSKVYKQSSFIEPMRLHRFIINLQEPGLRGVLPEIAVKENLWFDAKAIHPELEISGYGLLQNGKLVGRISRDEVTGIRWFLPHLFRAVVIVNQHGNAIATMTIDSQRRRIRPVVTGGRLRFDVQMEVNGTVVQMGKAVSEVQLKSMFAQEIQKEIRSTYANGLRLGVDIYALSDSLYRRDPQTFHRYASNDGHIQLHEDSLRRVQVKVKIHDQGKTTEPATRFTS